MFRTGKAKKFWHCHKYLKKWKSGITPFPEDRLLDSRDNAHPPGFYRLCTCLLTFFHVWPVKMEQGSLCTLSVCCRPISENILSTIVSLLLLNVPCIALSRSLSVWLSHQHNACFHSNDSFAPTLYFQVGAVGMMCYWRISHHSISSSKEG